MCSASGEIGTADRPIEILHCKMRGKSVYVLCVLSLCGLIGFCAALGEFSCLRISSCSCKLVGLAGEIGVIDLSPLKEK